MACVWDCGNGWDGYDQPLHTGLDDATKKLMIGRLDLWNSTTCYPMVKSGGACLKGSSAESMRNAMEQAQRTEFFQVIL